jgi:hypothetical protein
LCWEDLGTPSLRFRLIRHPARRFPPSRYSRGLAAFSSPIAERLPEAASVWVGPVIDFTLGLAVYESPYSNIRLVATAGTYYVKAISLLEMLEGIAPTV